jgi:hypothetical protein
LALVTENECVSCESETKLLYVTLHVIKFPYVLMEVCSLLEETKEDFHQINLAFCLNPWRFLCTNKEVSLLLCSHAMSYFIVAASIFSIRRTELIQPPKRLKEFRGSVHVRVFYIDLSEEVHMEDRKGNGRII